MRRGTTTMKMISSTSTTSTSGVMLISDCRLEPESPVLTCMMSFPLCARVLGEQPYSAEAGLLDREHGLADRPEVKLCVAPNHDLGVLFGAHRRAKGFAELFGSDRLIVDPKPSGVVDGDNDLASLVALLTWLCRVRHVDVRSLPHRRRHHHEDDQQHQHHVNERRDVDGRLHLGRITESHRLAPPPCSPVP